MENDEQYMKSLYERFRAEVMDGGQIDFYDREELLDIYDYAQDEGDITVQLWVFLVAARQFPDADKFLGERMGFFVSYIDGNAGMDMLERKQREDTPLWDVLRMSISDPANQDIEGEVNRLMEKHEHFDSETVIKLVDYLRNQKRTELLGRNIKQLRKKAEDLPGLEFEVAAAMLDTSTDLNEAARITEELTETEPFNIDNWILLSKIELMREHFPEATAAADYAQAIDPDYLPARVLSAVGQAAQAETRARGIERLQAIAEEAPSDAVAYKALAIALAEEGRTEEYVEASLRFWATAPEENSHIFVEILRHKPTGEPLENALEMFMAATAKNEEKWLQAASAFMEEGLIDLALGILLYYNNKVGLHRGMELFLLLLYLKRKWRILTDQFTVCFQTNNEYLSMNGVVEKDHDTDVTEGSEQNEATERPGDSDDADDMGDMPFKFSVNAYLIYAAASLMVGDYETAIDVTDMMINNPVVPSNFDDRIRMRGILDIARDIKRWAENPETIPTDPGFDPIG